MELITGLLILLFFVALYLSPIATAYQRKTDNVAQVAVVNLLLGWTLIGWVIALVMAYKPVKK
jgi:hypothetical protein